MIERKQYENRDLKYENKAFKFISCENKRLWIKSKEKSQNEY